jgi:hypothetical protein
MVALNPAAASRIMQRLNSGSTGRTEAYPIATRAVSPPRYPLEGMRGRLKGWSRRGNAFGRAGSV